MLMTSTLLFGQADGNIVDRIITAAASQITGSPEAAERVLRMLMDAREVVENASTWGLLPLGAAALVLHELTRSAEESRPFRIAVVVVRTLLVVAALLGYERIVGVITSVAGAGGSWPTWDSTVEWANQGAELVVNKWDGFSSIPRVMLFLLVFMVLTAASLFVYIVTLLLSMSQGVLMAILVSLGKLCITVSLVPGVAIGRSWAKLLGMVAAWSTVGGSIAYLMAVDQAQVLAILKEEQAGGVLRLSAQLFVMGAALAATPWLTAAIFSGVAAMAPGFGGVSKNLLRAGTGALGRTDRGLRSGVQWIRDKMSDGEDEPGGGRGRSGGPRGGSSGGPSGGRFARVASAMPRGGARPAPASRPPSSPVAKLRPGQQAPGTGRATDPHAGSGNSVQAEPRAESAATAMPDRAGHGSGEPASTPVAEHASRVPGDVQPAAAAHATATCGSDPHPASPDPIATAEHRPAQAATRPTGGDTGGASESARPASRPQDAAPDRDRRGGSAVPAQPRESAAPRVPDTPRAGQPAPQNDAALPPVRRQETGTPQRKPDHAVPRPSKQERAPARPAEGQPAEAGSHDRVGATEPRRSEP